MHRSFLEIFIDVLFDFTYKTNFYEAIIFYFFYAIFGFLISIVSIVLVAVFPILHNIFVLLTPFIFYTFVSVRIRLKKDLKDHDSFYLVLFTIFITLFIPLILGMQLGLCIFSLWFLPAIALGPIPAAILTTYEDYSLSKMFQKFDKEKIIKERELEKRLLIERETIRKAEELKNNKNDDECCE